jgi:hypothetical protein
VMLLSRRGMDVHLVLRFLMYREIKTCLYTVCVYYTGHPVPGPGNQYRVASTFSLTFYDLVRGKVPSF